MKFFCLKNVMNVMDIAKIPDENTWINNESARHHSPKKDGA